MDSTAADGLDPGPGAAALAAEGAQTQPVSSQSSLQKSQQQPLCDCCCRGWYMQLNILLLFLPLFLGSDIKKLGTWQMLTGPAHLQHSQMTAVYNQPSMACPT